MNEPRLTTNPPQINYTNNPAWSHTAVLDRDARVWQHKDKWVCVTQGVGGPQVCEWSQLVERHGPLIEATVGRVITSSVTGNRDE